MEKIDILVKGCPIAIHNMFKGYCSMSGKSLSDGIIDAMLETIERTIGVNADLTAILEEYRGARSRS